MAGAVARGAIQCGQCIDAQSCLDIGDLAGFDAVFISSLRQDLEEWKVWPACDRFLEGAVNGMRVNCVRSWHRYMNNWMLPNALSQFTRSIRFNCIFNAPSTSKMWWRLQPANKVCSSMRVSR